MINSRKYKKKSKSFLSRRFFKIEIFFFFRDFQFHRTWYLNECKLTLLKIGIQVSFRTIVRDARLIPEKRTKWRDVLLLGVAVSLFMLLVSLMIRPIGVYQIIQSTLSCFLSACTRFGFHPPCSRRCFRFFLLCLLPKESEFFRFALELYFPCLSFLYSYVFRRKIRLKESFVELGFNFKDRWNNWLLVTRWRKFS